MRRKSGGTRQRIWNVLMEADGALTPMVIKRATRANSIITIRTYLNLLRRNGYAEKSDEGWKLTRKTGPVSPSVNASTGDFRDWNIDKPMRPSRLMAAYEAHGGSLSRFCVALGFDSHGATRMRQMMVGQRPITAPVEAAVKQFEKTIAA